MRAPSPTVERGDPAGIRLTGTLPARIPPRATVHAALTVAMDRCDGAPGLMAPDVDTLRSAVCRACGGLGALVSLVAPGTVGADATPVTSPFPSCWTSRPTGCGRCASSAGPVPGRPGPTWLQPAPGAVDTQRNYAAGDRPSVPDVSAVTPGVRVSERSGGATQRCPMSSKPLTCRYPYAPPTTNGRSSRSSRDSWMESRRSVRSLTL